ncbi:hypothetical protein IT408_03440 [Candidatus Uhrbacteria bacterium]|nr:hypothetical protein [Candidatus Uhrbacteria bacterium]
MAKPHIFLEGKLELIDHRAVLTTEIHEKLGKGVYELFTQTLPLEAGIYRVWLVSYGQTVLTEEIFASPPHPEAICGNIRELFQLMRKLHKYLEGHCVVAPNEDQSTYVKIQHGCTSYGCSPGKPYWAKNCSFLFLGASLGFEFFVILIDENS